MKIAHLADLHLGFRQYDRWTKGRNAREVDVEEAVARAFSAVAAAQPGLVLLAGDVFHSVRPPNASILFLFRELQKLRAALPDATVVMIAGDHDSPRSSDNTSIIPLFGALGVHVVQGGEPATVRFPGGAVVAVPKWAVKKIPPPVAALGANVLLAHGEARKVGRLEPEIAPGALEGWDYAALGHWHVHQQVAPTAFYAGSLEYTSTNPWDELREQRERNVVGKGWLEVELGGAVTFRPVETRRHLDLGTVDVAGLGAPEAQAAIIERLSVEALDGAVVRLAVDNLSRLVQRDLQPRALAVVKARALHVNVMVSRPPEESPTPASRAMRFKQLDQIVDEFLGKRDLPSDVDRSALQTLGQDILKEVEA